MVVRSRLLIPHNVRRYLLVSVFAIHLIGAVVYGRSELVVRAVCGEFEGLRMVILLPHPHILQLQLLIVDWPMPIPLLLLFRETATSESGATNAPAVETAARIN